MNEWRGSLGLVYMYNSKKKDMFKVSTEGPALVQSYDEEEIK